MDPEVEVMEPAVLDGEHLGTDVMDHETTITAPAVGKVPAEALPTLVAAKPPDAPLCGSVLVLIQFDVCEEIRLDELRQILGARTADASFKHLAPGYVRYQRPPVEEALEPLVLESGERLQGDIKYFDYGVVSVVFELPFSGDWDKLVQLSSRWVWDTNFESLATRIVKQKLERAAPALVKPYTSRVAAGRLFHLPPARDCRLTLRDRPARFSRRLHRPGRARRNPAALRWRTPGNSAIADFLLSQRPRRDRMERRLHLRQSRRRRDRHPAPAVRQLAVARVPPLRRTAHQATGRVYDFLDRGGRGLWSRWRTARAASKLHTVLLDVSELTERADNAIKFLSDMFSARLYKLAALKVGVPDYKDLVQQKLQTAEELYRFMVDEFNQSRAFVLELMVVIILIIELIYFFRGKPI